MLGLLPILIMFLFYGVPIIIAVFIYKEYKKNQMRAEERLQMEKERTFTLQKQVEDLNNRLVKVEKLLSEVE